MITPDYTPFMGQCTKRTDGIGSEKGMLNG